MNPNLCDIIYTCEYIRKCVLCRLDADQFLGAIFGWAGKLSRSIVISSVWIKKVIGLFIESLNIQLLFSRRIATLKYRIYLLLLSWLNWHSKQNRRAFLKNYKHRDPPKNNCPGTVFCVCTVLTLNQWTCFIYFL